MNWPYTTTVNFRCEYPNCDSKVFHQVDTKGIFRNVSGAVIWDLSSEILIIYYSTCAYHALEDTYSYHQNCQAQ